MKPEARGRALPCGSAIGKSATEDIGSTAPPGKEVPVGKLSVPMVNPMFYAHATKQAARVVLTPIPSNDSRPETKRGWGDSQHTFGDCVISVILDSIPVWHDSVLSRQYLIRRVP